MKNTTFSLSPFVSVVLALTVLLSIVLSNMDWKMLNAAAAHHLFPQADDYELEHCLDGSHGDYADDPEMLVPADYMSTKLYVMDASLAVAVDTINGTFAVYDDQGTSGGRIESVSWRGDTCDINIGDNYVISIVDEDVVFTGEK